MIILTTSLLFSLAVHTQSLLRYSTRERPFEDDTHAHGRAGRHGTSINLPAARLPPSVWGTIVRDERLTKLDHLVIVAGHSVYTGCSPDDRSDESKWLLEERQRGGGNVDAFFSHIEAG